MLDHYSACLLSIGFHFSLEDRPIALILTVHCHCLSSTLQNSVGPFLFWSINVFSKFKEEQNVAGYIKKVSDHDQEIQQSHTAYQPKAPRGRIKGYLQ